MKLEKKEQEADLWVGVIRWENASSKQSESCIRQAKRWLTSKRADWGTFFASYTEKLLLKMAAKGELIWVIGGSETAADCVTLMRLQIAYAIAIERQKAAAA